MISATPPLINETPPEASTLPRARFLPKAAPRIRRPAFRYSLPLFAFFRALRPPGVTNLSNSSLRPRPSLSRTRPPDKAGLARLPRTRVPIHRLQHGPRCQEERRNRSGLAELWPSSGPGWLPSW